jgi:hypothetical protein
VGSFVNARADRLGEGEGKQGEGRGRKIDTKGSRKSSAGAGATVLGVGDLDMKTKLLISLRSGPVASI